MSQSVEIFENEEASKLLDYFVAYKKLMSKVEYVKRISAVNGDIQVRENRSAETADFTSKETTQSSISYPISIQK